MDSSSHRDSKDFPERLSSELRPERQTIPCAACRNLDCHSLHGPVRHKCLLHGCHVCAELTRINKEISSTQNRLTDLVELRKQVMAKPSHDTLIRRMPVEILSSIFVFLKDAIVGAKLDYDRGCPRRAESTRRCMKQPSQSPPLVGAVCKKWRDVTLTMPQLWTDIIVNLMKHADGQLKMVEKWAQRSGTFRLLNISIIQTDEDAKEEYDDILALLRSLVLRWQDISLEVLSNYFLRGLFHDLPEVPNLRTVFLTPFCPEFATFEMQHPLRPRHFMSSLYCVADVPFNWDKLVFLDIERCTYDEILDIILHAQNLQHCSARGFDAGESVPTVTNRSLTSLKTNCDIFDHLNLPSLLDLEYELSSPIADEGTVESIAGFLVRSRPPLPNLTIRYYTNGQKSIPSFKQLPEVTSLHILRKDRSPSTGRIEEFLQALTQPSASTILPHLKELSFEANELDFSESTWSLIADLFPQASQTNPAVGLGATSDTSIAFRRPLSQVKIVLTNNTALPMIPKDSLFRLFEVKKSGVQLLLLDSSLGDLFSYLAESYGVKL